MPANDLTQRLHIAKKNHALTDAAYMLLSNHARAYGKEFFLEYGKDIEIDSEFYTQCQEGYKLLVDEKLLKLGMRAKIVVTDSAKHIAESIPVPSYSLTSLAKDELFGGK